MQAREKGDRARERIFYIFVQNSVIFMLKNKNRVVLIQKKIYEIYNQQT